MEAQTRLPWTAEEDTVLIDLVQKYGEKRWNMVANGLPGRTGKGCSHRWRTYLRPDVKHPHLEPFTEWEAAVIVQAQQEMGNNWLAIAKLLLPGRSNTAVKNFWHCRLKSGSGTHTNRFIVENYNLRYLLNEVEEKDRLHPVALPAFPSTAPTGHVRRQIHPRPRQEAAAQAAAFAEAQLAAAQMTAQAQAMGLDVQTYMQQQGMVDPSGGYAGMYGSYDTSQMAMSQGFSSHGGGPSSGSFATKEELKLQASAYVQQQLAMMGHPPSSRHASGGGASGWQQGYSQEPNPAAAAAAGGSGGVKKGRGRGRPPGSKSQQAQAHSNADTAGLEASAATADHQLQAHMYQQHQHSMRLSQDEAATWCSTGMMVAGTAAAAAGRPSGGSPGAEVHSSATYMLQGTMPHSSSAAAAAGDPLDPAALAAAPVPLESDDPAGLAAAAAAAAGVHHPAAAAGAGGAAAAAGAEGAAAAELGAMGAPFRVSMTGLDFELEAAQHGAQTVRFSARTLKLFDCEEGVHINMAGFKPSIGSMDFRTSLTSFDEILGNNAAVNRMSDDTHIALRGPSWDGASSPHSRPSDVTAATAAGQAVAAAAAGPPPSAAAVASSAAAAGYACTSSEADNALAAAFKQQQPPSASMPPPSSSGSGMHVPSWIAAQQPPNSAAAAASSAPASSQLHPGSLAAVHSGSFSFTAAAAAAEHEDIHPGAIAALAGVAAALGADVQGTDSPFGARGLQAAPFSPSAGPAAAAAQAAGHSSEAAVDSSSQAQLHQHALAGPPPPAAASAAAGGEAAAAARDPPSAPRMPPAFQSVLQALQPPAAAPISGSAGLAGAVAAVSALIKSESQQQQQQQHVGCESALAAASPAITGLIGPGSMPTSSMAPAAYFVPAAAGHHQHMLQQQQHQHMLQQMQPPMGLIGMSMPMSLPPQLLLPSQQYHNSSSMQQGAGAQRVSELPLPSPIDLFHGDHGLHNDDLLIDATEVFDESMLQANQQAQLQQLQQLQQQLQQHKKRAGAAQHTAQFARACAGDLANDADTSAAAAAGLCRAAADAGYYQQQPSGSHDAEAAGGAGVSQQQAQGHGGVKRRRSSPNGAGWQGKRQRPSEGSLVEVCSSGQQHGMDDCLRFWHD